MAYVYTYASLQEYEGFEVLIRRTSVSLDQQSAESSHSSSSSSNSNNNNSSSGRPRLTFGLRTLSVSMLPDMNYQVPPPGSRPA